MSELVCCFTGHRNQKLPWGFTESGERFNAVKQQAEHQIDKAIEDGFTTFICGMALGFDMLCAEIVLDRKDKLRESKPIKFICAIPCENQDKFWNEKQQKRYKYLMDRADMVYFASKTYNPYCTEKRNRFMVDNSSRVIALFGGCDGGTKNTLEYAFKAGKDVVIIQP